MNKSIWIILLYTFTNNGCNFNSIRSYYINTEKSFVIFINPCKIILFINIENEFYMLRCFSIEIVVSSCKLKETFIILLKMKLYSIQVLELFQRSEWSIEWKEWLIHHHLYQIKYFKILKEFKSSKVISPFWSSSKYKN